MRRERAGPDFRRIVTDYGAVVGFASRLTSGKWCALDYDGVRIAEAGVLENDRQVMKWFEMKEKP